MRFTLHADSLGKDFGHIGDLAENVLRRFGGVADHGVTLDLGLLRLFLPPLLVAQLLLLPLLVGSGAETVRLGDLVQLLLLVVEIAVVVVIIHFDVALATDIGVPLAATRFATDDDAGTEALDEVGEFPSLLFDLLRLGSVLDRMIDTGDQALVSRLVRGVGRRWRDARRRRNGREQDFARLRIGDEGSLREESAAVSTCYQFLEAA